MKFPTDASALSPEAEQRLAQFAQRLQGENKNVYLEIQGYTDATGPVEYNNQLGEQRAEAVGGAVEAVGDTKAAGASAAGRAARTGGGRDRAERGR